MKRRRQYEDKDEFHHGSKDKSDSKRKAAIQKGGIFLVCVYA